jgi:hypothetical protein
MAGTRAAIRYAKAILDKLKGVAEAVDEIWNQSLTISSNEELNAHQNPTTRVEGKKST